MGGRRSKAAAPPAVDDSDQDDTPAFTPEEERERSEPDDEGRVPLSVAKAKGALTSDAVARNKKNETTKRRKLKGEKYVPWNETGPVLYALIVETHGLEKVKIHVEKTMPEHADRGLHQLSNIPDFETLRRMIVDSFWDGKKSTYKWTALKNGSQRLGCDTIEFDEDPIAQQKWAAKMAPAAQQAQAGTTGAMQNGQPVIVQQPAAVPQALPQEQVNFFLSRLERMENRLDSAVNKAPRSDEEEEEEEEEEQEPEAFRPRTPVHQGFSQPIHEAPPMTGSYPHAPPPSAQQQDQWEQVLTPSGTIAFVKKAVVTRPPPDLPEPPAGCAWQVTAGGAWIGVPIGAEQRYAAPQAPAQQQAPAVPPPAPEPIQTAGMSSAERDLLEQKHQLEMELAVTKERYKMMGDLNKVRQEVAMMSQPQQQTPPPQQQQQQQQQGVLPPPPAGHVWQQSPSGMLMAVPFAAAGVMVQQQPIMQAAPQAPVPVPQTPAEQVRSLADTLKGVSNLMNVTKSIFPKDEGLAHGPGALAEAAAAAADDGLPLTKLDAGGWQMYFDKETRKPVDAATQIALNLGNIKDAGKGIVTEALDGYRKIVEQQENGKAAKLEKDRAEMAVFIRQQQEKLNETNRRLEYMERQRHQERIHEQYMVEEVEDEPSPPPAAPMPVVTSSLASGAMSAFGRSKK